MTLSDDDFDFDFDVDTYCGQCGRPFADRLDRAAAVAWVVTLVLTGLASVLVIALCVKALV